MWRNIPRNTCPKPGLVLGKDAITVHSGVPSQSTITWALSALINLELVRVEIAEKPEGIFELNGDALIKQIFTFRC